MILFDYENFIFAIETFCYYNKDGISFLLVKVKF